MATFAVYGGKAESIFFADITSSSLFRNYFSTIIFKSSTIVIRMFKMRYTTYDGSPLRVAVPRHFRCQLYAQMSKFLFNLKAVHSWVLALSLYSDFFLSPIQQTYCFRSWYFMRQ